MSKKQSLQIPKFPLLNRRIFTRDKRIITHVEPTSVMAVADEETGQAIGLGTVTSLQPTFWHPARGKRRISGILISPPVVPLGAGIAYAIDWEIVLTEPTAFSNIEGLYIARWAGGGGEWLDVAGMAQTGWGITGKGYMWIARGDQYPDPEVFYEGAGRIGWKFNPLKTIWFVDDKTDPNEVPHQPPGAWPTFTPSSPGKIVCALVSTSDTIDYLVDDGGFSSGVKTQLAAFPFNYVLEQSTLTASGRAYLFIFDINYYNLIPVAERRLTITLHQYASAWNPAIIRDEPEPSFVRDYYDEAGFNAAAAVNFIFHYDRTGTSRFLTGVLGKGMKLTYGASRMLGATVTLKTDMDLTGTTLLDAACHIERHWFLDWWRNIFTSGYYELKYLGWDSDPANDSSTGDVPLDQWPPIQFPTI